MVPASSGGYSFAWRRRGRSRFAGSLFRHWFLPFLSLFLVAFGGWAIGMRNMIIYELEADYTHYLESLGAPRRLVRRYAFRNALLPQLTGLALQLGVIVAGALVTEIVFSYPGLGYLVLQAINNQDFFLLQGIFLFIIIGVLVANFLIDIVYVMVDPRHRGPGLTGGRTAAMTPSEAAARRPRTAPCRNRQASVGPRALYFAVASEAHRPGVIARGVVAIVGPLLHRPRPQRLRRPARPAAVGRLLVRHHHLRPGRLRPVRPRPAAPRSWSGCWAAGWRGLIGMTIGFVAGYRGGLVDEVLNMLTNVVLVIPTLVVLHHRGRLRAGHGRARWRRSSSA